MKYTLNISNAAENDIREIVGYFDDVLKNPKAADSFLFALKEQAAIIADNPFITAEITETSIECLHLHKIMVKSYLMFYEITDSIVNIIRVLHSRRKWESILSDDNEKAQK